MSAPARNPFPGPQPFRAEDQDFFFGRAAVARELESRVLVRACTLLYGPSGAGKSSLMRAEVIPGLEERHEFRVVRVDAWPDDAAPLAWLVRALFAELEVGPAPAQSASLEALDEAMTLAELRSDSPVLIYLDQLEQLLGRGHDRDRVDALLAGVDRLARRPMSGLQIVLSLREDYLGRFRDRARGKPALLEHALRLGPLTVGEMVAAVLAAVGRGAPPQAWDEGEVRRLMGEVRAPGTSDTEGAEVQAAFGQIVCRTLWEDRAAGRRSATEPGEAAVILQRYLDATLDGLGEHREDARRLLERHLIDEQGHRRLLTEREARDALPPGAANEVLARLQAAAILRGEEHQGSQYFELSHDWLAARVLERKQERVSRRSRLARAVRWCRRNRAAALLIGLALATLVTLTLWSIDGARAQDRARRAEVLDSNAYAARAVAGAVLHQLTEYGGVVAREARDPGLVAALARGDDEALQAFCAAAHARQSSATPRTDWIIVDASGHLRAVFFPDIDRLQRMQPRNYAFRDYFRGASALPASAEPHVYVSRGFRATTDGRFKVGLAAPIAGAGGTFSGVLVAELTTDRSFGGLNLSDDTRVAVLTVRHDREDAAALLSTDHLLLVHGGVEHGEGVVVESEALRRLTARRDAAGPPGDAQLHLPPQEWVDTEEGYRDPLADRDPHGARGPWLIGVAAVGRTELAVIVQTSLEAATALDRKPLAVLVAWGIGGAVLLLASLFAALWTDREDWRGRPE
jgi:hypothetical protein